MTNSVVFISNQLICGGDFEEQAVCFDTQRLHCYLKRTARLNLFHSTEVTVTRENGHQCLLINVELHNRLGEKLYALCSPRDPSNPEQWTMERVLTLQDLAAMNIDIQDKPRGVREVSTAFRQHQADIGNMNRMKEKILNGDRRLHLIRNSQSTTTFGRKWRTRRSAQRQKTVNQLVFCQSVRASLQSQDPNTDLIPIVSRTNRIFSIGYLLPVRLGPDWFGVVYRHGQSVMVLVDSCDITNRAILCDPSFDAEGFQWFTNSFDKLSVVPSATVVDDDDEDQSTGPKALDSKQLFHETPSPNLPTHWNCSQLVAPYGMTQFVAFEYPSNEELLGFMKQLRVNAEHNAAYFQQFIEWGPRGQQ